MVNKYKSELSTLQSEILNFFFIKSDLTFNIHQLSKALEVSQPGVAKALKLLEKKQYITKQKQDSGRWDIKLNDNLKTIQLKRVYNLKQLYQSNLPTFLFDKFPGATIILFGSYSRGEDTTNSDIDIAIIGYKEKKLNLEKYNKLLEREIILQFYDSLGKIHKNLRNNLLNGITLRGYVGNA